MYQLLPSCSLTDFHDLLMTDVKRLKKVHACLDKRHEWLIQFSLLEHHLMNESLEQHAGLVQFAHVIPIDQLLYYQSLIVPFSHLTLSMIRTSQFLSPLMSLNHVD